MSKLHAAIATRFCQPEWATMFEVRDATGFQGAGRSADAVAMNCYPSRGMEIHGFEVKASRGDWLRELRAPQKSAAVQKYCDRWWIVTTEEVIKGDLFPPTWGLMLLTGKGLQISTQAPKLEPIAPDRFFMASMLRSAVKAAETMIPAMVEGERERIRADEEARFKMRLQNVREDGAEMLKQVEKIKEATGIDLRAYHPSGEIAAALKFAMGVELHGYDKLKSLIRGARGLLAAVELAKVYGIDLKDDA